MIQRVKAKQGYLTHMSHSVDYDVIGPTLPANIALAYDGLKFRF